MRVLLVLVNERWRGKRPWMATPQTALILTALLKPGFDFSVIDANGADLSESDCLARMRELKPDVVLITGISSEYHGHYHAVARMAKELRPAPQVVMGGVYPTVLGEEVLKDACVDYIFVGHAEGRVEEFLRLVLARDREAVTRLAGVGFRDESRGTVINPVTTYIADVKQLAKPDYSLIDLEPYLLNRSLNYQTNSPVKSAQVVTSFGCPYNCVFCATRTISGRRVAYRPVEDVLEEIEFLRTRYGVKNLVFMDDNFLGDKARAAVLLKALAERGDGLTWKIATVAAWHLTEDILPLLKRAGCSQLTISVESGSERVLREIIRKPVKLETIAPLVKRCRGLGIDIGANFVIGFPGETWDEIRASFRFAEACDFDVVHFHIATPLPKTELYRVAREKGYLPPDFSFTDSRTFGFARAFITTDEFTPEELMVLRAYEYDRINFSTPEKKARVARLYNATPEEIERHRRETRRKIGIHF